MGTERLILPDTSVWIEHLRGTTDELKTILEDEVCSVATHPMILAELVLGGLRKESAAWANLTRQIVLKVVSHDDLLLFLQANHIAGKGIGYVDCNLIASCLISNARIITFDKKLAAVAADFGVTYEPCRRF
jgi:predicted nucleic acid-binding protein